MYKKNNIENIINLLVEKVISSLKAKESGKKFNYQDFLHSDNKLNYARKTLPKLGEGSSRVVFQFGTGKVLKIAKPPTAFGIEQNKGELHASSLNDSLLPKVYAWDKKDYLWILSESVQEFTKDSEQFENITGIDFNLFSEIVWYMAFGEFNELISQYGLNPEQIQFLKKIKSLHNKGVDLQDMAKISHWGINSERQLKYLDPGLSVY